jgi:D-alanine--poly(phosphoribitol) ligase subunit 1
MGCGAAGRMCAVTECPAGVEDMASWFAAVATGAPDSTAIRDGDQRVSYQRLWEESEHHSHALRAAGVSPGVLVGLRMDRSWRVVAAILGIWRHGCGYVPVDPSHPQARQEYIVRDAELAYLVEEDGRCVRLPTAHPPAILGRDVAYVIYTSGSTGEPKGVVISQTNLLAMFGSLPQVMHAGPDDVWSLFHSTTFDASVWETWGALLTGGACVVVPKQVTIDPPRMLSLLYSTGVTVLTQVPSSFKYLVGALKEVPRVLPSLRYVILSGEAIHIPSLMHWLGLGVAPSAQLINMYGLTETTAVVTVKHLDLASLRRPAAGTPIGAALPHLEIELMENGRAVDPGAPGEIYVAGAGVARGYLKRTELTNERFPVLDGKRWYRSGDFAVRTPDGELAYLGRRDDQIKLRGFRIEPSEIETALALHPAVRDGAVVLAAAPSGEARLVACVVACDGDGDTTDEEWSKSVGAALRAAMSAQLPRHMVPDRYVRLQALPLTVSGKLDRAALTARVQANR